MLMTALSVARMAPPRLAAPPMVRTELGARNREEPVFIWRELIL